MPAFVVGIVAPALPAPRPAGALPPVAVKAYAEAAGARTREIWLSGAWWKSDPRASWLPCAATAGRWR